MSPIDLVYGMAGCHSSFAKLFSDTAEKEKVDLYELIIKVSAIDKKAPSKELIEQIADGMK